MRLRAHRSDASRRNGVSRESASLRGREKRAWQHRGGAEAGMDEMGPHRDLVISRGFRGGVVCATRVHEAGCDSGLDEVELDHPRRAPGLESPE